MVEACLGFVQMLASKEELCPIELSNKYEQGTVVGEQSKCQTECI
jgi:hypothetical protein